MGPGDDIMTERFVAYPKTLGPGVIVDIVRDADQRAFAVFSSQNRAQMAARGLNKGTRPIDLYVWYMEVEPVRFVAVRRTFNGLTRSFGGPTSSGTTFVITIPGSEQLCDAVHDTMTDEYAPFGSKADGVAHRLNKNPAMRTEFIWYTEVDTDDQDG